MATFYFNGAADIQAENWAVYWSNLGNWWMNSAFTVPATALPTSTDDVVISATIDYPTFDNPPAYITVANLTVESGQFFVLGSTLVVTGAATFNGSSICLATIDGNCEFNGVSRNSGNIDGNCEFNGISYSEGATITGDVTFNGSSYSNGATITGDVTFNDSSHNDSSTALTSGGGWVCTFNNSSYNTDLGTVTGDCVLNNSSGNGGFINGNATFNDNATNAIFLVSAEHPEGYWDTGVIQGNCTFSAESAIANLRIFGNADFTGTMDVVYDKGINGSSILGVV